MPTIEERLRDTGQVWREHVDAVEPHPIRASITARSKLRKRRTVLVAAAAVVVAGIGIPAAAVLGQRAADHNVNQGGVGASCAGPQLQLVGASKTVRTTAVRPGQQLTVTGRFYLDSCQDTNHAPDPHPLTVGISLHGHGRTVPLRTVRAHGELGTFRIRVQIPADYPLGSTTITTRTAGPQADLAAGSPTAPIILNIVK